ncbi:serine hydrolase family protein [Candidatus Woesearchaeota archaeon]|nr:serine hydrolase family protein [Candidatus Woesearchaeota archaeon]
MKRVFIVHGWEFSPEQHWYQWLKKELEKKGFKVIVPSMPNTAAPKIESWVKTLSNTVGTPDKDTVLVGHSIGCQAILRYLQKNGPVCGCVLVAPWFTLTPAALPDDDYQAIAKPWLETPITFTKVKTIAIFSDDDPYVPQENITLMEQRAGAKIVLDKEKGHFTSDEGATTLPSALKAVLELAK